MKKPVVVFDSDLIVAIRQWLSIFNDYVYYFHACTACITWRPWDSRRLIFDFNAHCLGTSGDFL
jgi:hypothetical protein